MNSLNPGAIPEVLEHLTDFEFASRVTGMHADGARFEIIELASWIDVPGLLAGDAADFVQKAESFDPPAIVGVGPDFEFYLEVIGENGRLDDEVEKGPIHWEEALWVGEQICHILGEAHNGGFVHGELSTASVNLDGSMNPTIVGLQAAIEARRARSRRENGFAIANPVQDVAAIGQIIHQVITGGEASGLPNSDLPHSAYDEVPDRVANLVQTACDAKFASAPHLALAIQEIGNAETPMPSGDGRLATRYVPSSVSFGVFSLPEPLSCGDAVLAALPGNYSPGKPVDRNSVARIEPPQMGVFQLHRRASIVTTALVVASLAMFIGRVMLDSTAVSDDVQVMGATQFASDAEPLAGNQTLNVLPESDVVPDSETSRPASSTPATSSTTTSPPSTTRTSEVAGIVTQTIDRAGPALTPRPSTIVTKPPTTSAPAGASSSVPDTLAFVPVASTLVPTASVASSTSTTSSSSTSTSTSTTSSSTTLISTSVPTTASSPATVSAAPPGHSTSTAPETTTSPTTASPTTGVVTEPESSAGEVALTIGSVSVDAGFESAVLTFTTSHCTTASVTIVNGGSLDRSAMECASRHSVRIGGVPYNGTQLRPGQDHTVKVVVRSVDGAQASRSLRVTTIEQPAEPLRISGLTVTEITASTARVSFQANKCVGSSFVVVAGGSGRYDWGQPVTQHCLTDQWATVGYFQSSKLLSGADNTVRVTATTAAGESVSSSITFYVPAPK